jgi:NADH:ubiquinone oxidoreductase subunit 6 (subunit J)
VKAVNLETIGLMLIPALIVVALLVVRGAADGARQRLVPNHWPFNMIGKHLFNRYVIVPVLIGALMAIQWVSDLLA